MSAVRGVIEFGFSELQKLQCHPWEDRFYFYVLRDREKETPEI